ncbi:hypothetical protein RFN29_30470 [Mesorhizobium sp. VK22B]|uniref:Uncharacterized protein n=1 Tax=Mesorhizobium captivum TaxID=3072319 RepID=A0ABU4Z9C5_9HYPH|nr:hypothetical protein [Mesorhizobium sp. VK22B]MDX8495872.1 hypothetical protein [Mesorhizobium sp. VK22B]
MQAVLLGASGTLTVAAIIAVVTLAFKDPEAYTRLCKVLLSLLAACVIGYIAYALGSIAGGKSAADQIKSGVSADAVSTGLPGWPLGAASVVFSVLVTLIWFPEYLRIKGKSDGDKKLN